MRVAIQGTHGSFSEAAARRRWPGLETLPCREAKDVVTAVRDGRAEAGCLPIENSLIGSVTTTYDLLEKALDTLRKARGRPLGIVLNKVPLRGADATAYSYEYRRDYTSTKKGEEAPAPEPADIEIPAPLDDELVSEPPTPARRGRRS